MSPTGQARRPYDAAGRRAQARATRERILATAQELFVARGYASVSVAEVAAAAGVSAPTVFAGFRTKANLLKEATETALVGDAEPVPLADRPAMRHVVAAPTARELVERFAALVAEAGPRVVPLYAVLHAAADADTELARLARTLDEQRLAGATRLATVVLERLGVPDPQRTDPDRLAEVRDTIWTFNSPQLWTLLVTGRGWSPQRYGRWAARALTALVAEP
jgi:AcrR family transcriptional regulator